MKALKAVFSVLTVLALISAPSVLAQEVDGWGPEVDDPYPQTEAAAPDAMIDEELARNSMVVRDGEGNISYIPIEEAPASVESPSLQDVPVTPEMMGTAPLTVPAEKPQSPLFEEADPTSRVVEPVTGLMSIATDAAPVWEYNPQVAHGGDYYVVAYVKDGLIYARVYNNNGAFLSTYIVDDYQTDTYEFNGPRIAYHAPSGLFLVAYYQIAATYNIWFTTVSPTSGQKGNYYGFTTGDSELYPDVACNQNAATCLVAYQHNSNTIKGKYVTLNTFGISSTSTLYNLTTTSGSRPYIAWGKGSGKYMLAYTWTDGSGVDFPVFNHIYDYNPGSDPYTHDAIYAHIFTGWAAYDKWATSIAYDPCTEKFILLWDYDYAGNGSDTDVKFSTIHNQHGTIYDYGSIANLFSNECSGDLNFVTDDNLTAACGQMDKLALVYTDWTNDRIIAADLRGNDNPASPNYSYDYEYQHFVVYDFSTNTTVFWRPSISSGSTKAQMFIAFNYHYLTTPNFNVYGRLVKVPAKVYFPTLLR